jgi:hypothetical protein
MRVSAGKCASSTSCTPFSHSGKPCTSISGILSQHCVKSLCCFGSIPVGQREYFFQSKRSALMIVISYTLTSSTSSHRMLRMNARTASAIVIATRPCEGRCTSISCEYLLTAVRAMHSWNSLKSSVAASLLAGSTSPTSSWSTDCERRKFQRHCASESATLKCSWFLRLTRSSPVISDSCVHRHSPTCPPGGWGDHG